MASRVNTKFVIILATSLSLVFVALAAVAYSVVRKTGDELIALGDKKMAEATAAEEAGSEADAQLAYRAASELYSRAVAKDRANTDYLDHWRTALEKWVPETQTEYRNAFNRYMAIFRQKAVLTKGQSIEPHMEYLSLVDQQISLGDLSRQSLDFMIGETATSLSYFEAGRADVLRKFRGRAIVELMENGMEVSDDQRALARQDLEAALAANPSDIPTVISLARWFNAEARRARAAQRAEEAIPFDEQSQQTLVSFLERNPEAPRAELALLQLDLDRLLNRRAMSGGSPASSREPIEAIRPRLDAVATKLEALPPERLDILTLARLRLVEAILTGNNTAERTRRVLDRAITGSPNDPDLLAMRARLFFEGREYDRAIEQYEQIAKLDMQPVSLAGLRLFTRRVEAIAQQAESVLGMWEKTQDRTQRAALVERAKGYRAALAQEIPADSPLLLLLDAKLAVASDSPAEAQRLLLQYNERTANTDVQGLWLLGQVTSRTQPGVARQQFERVLQMQPTNVAAIVALGTVEQQLQNLPRAIELFREAVTLDPGNEAAKTALRQAEIAGNLRQADDPVIQLVLEARRLEQGDAVQPGNPAAAAQALEAGLTKHDFDMRIVAELSRLYLEAEDIPQAISLVDRSLAKHPDNDVLQRLKRGLSSGDPMTIVTTMIDESTDSPLAKAIAKYRLYRTKGMAAEAEAQLAEAARLAPEDPGVIEMTFSHAMDTGNRASAQQIAEQASRLNTDRANGLTYRARLEIMDGRQADAIRTLQQAINSGASNPGVHRLLGRQLVSVGRMQEGFASYRRALEMRPDDLGTINEFIAVLVRAADLRQALDLARASEVYGRQDPTFQNLWMDLEASVGDKQLALERRRKLVELNPEDRSNRIALASILIELARWPEARKLLDELRASGDSLQLVELDAKWHADQNDINGARSVFVSHITTQDPATLTSMPYLAFGRFMLQRRMTDVGLSALAQARTRQDPKTLEADKELGDALFNLRRYGEAVTHYKSVLDADADTPDHTYRLRYAEALIRLKKVAEAETALAPLGERLENDPIILMLRADAAQEAGDMRRCRELLDKAVALAPDDPLVYVRRAQARSMESSLETQALADLDRALQLRPSFWQAMQVRSTIYAKQGRMDEALSELASAVAVNPALNDLRYGLMVELINRDRATEAAEVAEQGLGQRPGDLMLMLGSGQIFADRGMWNRASAFYRKAWMQARDVATAELYVESLLNSSPPDLGEVTNVLTAMGDRVKGQPALLIARAEVLAKRGRLDDARRELTGAYGEVKDSPRLVLAWYAGTKRVLNRPGDLAQYLELLEREFPSPWVTYMRGLTLAENPATMSQGLQLLQRVQATTDVQLGVLAFRSEGTAYYAQGRYEEAVEAWRRGLAKYADDWEMNNNVAYALAKHLGRPADAVPFAERAAQLNPNVSEIQDTLGIVYLENKQYDLAEKALERALELSRVGTESQATVLIHLGILERERGNREGALARAQSAEDLLKSIPNASESTRRDADDLIRSVQ